MSYYRRPYISTVLGRPYLNTMPITSTSIYEKPVVTKREYSYTSEREYSSDGPARKYEYEFESRSGRPGSSTYYPDYRSTITTSSHGYSPKWYNTTTTTTRAGPYGSSTRTYRY